MKEQSIAEVGESTPGWETLEAYAREGICDTEGRAWAAGRRD